MTDRIRVLLVIDSLAVGGAEALLPTFLQHVDRSRFDVRLLSLRAVAPNHIQDAIRDTDCPVTQWNGSGLLQPTRIRELARLIDELRIDVVHSHLLYSNVQVALAGKLAKRPQVATLHNLHQFSPLVKRKIESGVLRMTGARVLAVSHGVQRSFSGPLGLPAKHVVVVPNAVDLIRFRSLTAEDVSQVRLNALDGAAGPLIVGVGRVIPQKGFPNLVQAAAELARHVPEARVVIAGREADGAAEVRAEIDRLGLGGIVRLLGQRSDVAQLLAGADVFVSPSLSEGAPVTHLEAMAAGAPVVATRVGGVPEIITDGDNGLLVPASDPQALAAAILRLLSDQQLAQRLVQRGCETVSNYGADRWARRIEDQYMEVLSGRQRVGERRVAS